MSVLKWIDVAAAAAMKMNAKFKQSPNESKVHGACDPIHFVH